MNILVQKFEGNKVLDLLGVCMARLVPPTTRPPSPYLLTMEEVATFCDESKTMGILNDDEIATIKADCEALGMKPDLQAVVDAVQSIEIPTELAGDFEFRLCTKEKCILPWPHGYVYEKEQELEELLSTFEEAFSILHDANANITPEEVVHLLKQMAEVLPIDAVAQKALIDALPAEKQALLKKPDDSIAGLLGALLALSSDNVSVRVIRF